MRKILVFAATAALGLGLSLRASADEGMWMVQALNRAIEANMQAKGCKLSAGEIYNSDAQGSSLCDAIVSLDFMCTGSIVSDEGLVITNHHCAYSDVFELSTDEHNYLEDGYWAAFRKDEINIPGKRMLFLRKVIDVTEETQKMAETLGTAGKPMGMRKLSAVMEKKYEEEGLECSLESMWAGSKYYICYYEVYSDVRLVAAPPVSIAAFGGDIDNWDWPQHKCDFAMYRIYTAPDGKPADYSENNVPLKPRRKLGISLEGYKPGDFNMVIGFPGITHRYNSSSKVRFEQDVTLPVSNKVRGENMAIMNKWMNADPSVRLMYSDRYFGLSNVQELDEGTVTCYKRFDVVGEKQDIEKELQEWILADEGRKAQWGNLLDELEKTYSAIEEVKRNEMWFRECIVRSSAIFGVALRLNVGQKRSIETLPNIYNGMDLRVERDIFRNAIEEYYSNVSDAYLGAFQKSIKTQYGEDYDAICAAVWDASLLSDTANLAGIIDGSKDYKKDPLVLFMNDVKVNLYHELEAAASEKSTSALNREYTHALYQMREDKGIAQYADANSTMRLTYGTVGELSPRDAVISSWKSSTKGILEKYKPDQYEYQLKPEWKESLENNRFCKKFNWNGEVDFINDCDITGGNSGSPVMDAQGRLIGLAFDGNTESLAGDSSFTRDYNKCICADIRYVLFCLDNYCPRIITELGL